jgi:diaminopimelate decarboxylase
MLRARQLYRASKRQAQALLRPLVAAWDPDPSAFAPERWHLEHEPGHGLRLHGLRLHELLERFGSPLFVVDAKMLRSNAAAFQAVPAGASRGCEVFYSYKTNPIEAVLRELHAAGVGAEVISPYELWLALRLGVPPERILYNGPGKSDESIRTAIEANILAINCNHREELERVARIAKSLGRVARIGIRVNTEDSWTQQFGTPIRGGQALAAFQEALARPELELVALHAHRGGMIRSESELLSFVDQVLSFVGVLADAGVRLPMLDFGGSLGLATVAPLNARDRKLNQFLQRPMPLPELAGTLTIERYVRLVVERVEEVYRKRADPQPRILLEPGRAMTGNTQFLLASVLTIKEAEALRFAVLDAGINLAESVRNEHHQLFSVNRYGEPASRVHSVVGPICSPADTLYSAVLLPELRAGDSLAIMDAGAYFVPFSTSFSYPRPAIVQVDAGTATLIRERETFEDLTRHDRAANGL